MRSTIGATPALPVIRPATGDDIDEMVGIWLVSSRLAHGFIPFEFWQSHVDDMKNVYLPQSDSFVIESDGVIVGFLSLLADGLEALFISPECQKQGYGKRLLQFAKTRSAHLSLCAYKENANAVGFYSSQGFVVSSERVDVRTNRLELLMDWRKDGHAEAP